MDARSPLSRRGGDNGALCVGSGKQRLARIRELVRPWGLLRPAGTWTAAVKKHWRQNSAELQPRELERGSPPAEVTAEGMGSPPRERLSGDAEMRTKAALWRLRVSRRRHRVAAPGSGSGGRGGSQCCPAPTRTFSDHLRQARRANLKELLIFCK